MKKRTLISAALLCVVLLLSLCSTCACSQEYCSHLVAGTTVIAETCDEPGYTRHICALCGYIWQTDFVEPLGHDFSVTSIPSTCEESEQITYSCNTCGEKFTVAGAAPLGHTWVKSVNVPTCTTEGHTQYECSVCFASYEADETAPTGHAFTAKVTAPTCTAEGYTVYTCNDCGYSTVSERLPATGHEYVRKVTPPTTQRMGNIIYRCSVCGHSYVERYINVYDVLVGAAGDGNGALALGVDLSSHNGDVDFVELAKKVDYVILRVATSNLSVDTRFEEYYAAAKAAGLDVGCYYASYAVNEKEMAADIQKLQQLIAGKTFEYPIYLDIEKEEQRNIGKELMTNMITTYMESMIDAGWFPGLYTNNDFLKNAMNSSFIQALYDVWFAGYKYSQTNETVYSSMYGMWQYTNTGSMAGVTGDVDINVAFKDYPAIIAYYKLNGK